MKVSQPDADRRDGLDSDGMVHTTHGYAWGKKMSNSWLAGARTHRPSEERDGIFVNVHPLTQLAWTDCTALPSPPTSLRTQAQVIGRFATGASERPPSLLPFPGPGVVNSAARTMAMDVDWPTIFAIASQLESGSESADRVVDVVAASRGTHWQVAASGIEYVLAKALVGQIVSARPVDAASLTTLDRSKLYAPWRRAGVAYVEHPTGVPSDGWRRQDGIALLDPSAVMSSRDIEPIIWPKAWHFARKLGALDDAAAHAACFGAVPVRWVPAAGRWMTGNRHRVIAAMLRGLAVAASPVSGSPSMTALPEA